MERKVLTEALELLLVMQELIEELADDLPGLLHRDPEDRAARVDHIGHQVVGKRVADHPRSQTLLELGVARFPDVCDGHPRDSGPVRLHVEGGGGGRGGGSGRGGRSGGSKSRSRSRSKGEHIGQDGVWMLLLLLRIVEEMSWMGEIQNTDAGSYCRCEAVFTPNWPLSLAALA